MQIPIYGSSVTFREQQCDLLVDGESHQPAAYFDRSNGRLRARIGYDLLAEIRTLLTAGQPVFHASSPTLDLHIAVLRDLIVASGAPLVEIPPVPEGHRFIACLTHDVGTILPSVSTDLTTLCSGFYIARWSILWSI